MQKCSTPWAGIAIWANCRPIKMGNIIIVISPINLSACFSSSSPCCMNLLWRGLLSRSTSTHPLGACQTSHEKTTTSNLFQPLNQSPLWTSHSQQQFEKVMNLMASSWNLPLIKACSLASTWSLLTFKALATPMTWSSVGVTTIGLRAREETTMASLPASVIRFLNWKLGARSWRRNWWHVQRWQVEEEHEFQEVVSKV